ncbi:hypothetical protein [Kitasatospora sp. NPDC086791]|uniref:hypothetical protein n=1 Tax=Kitasatospora sp. NPDC086791 TaxID=3155178 RepID=UPI0034341931
MSDHDTPPRGIARLSVAGTSRTVETLTTLLSEYFTTTRPIHDDGRTWLDVDTRTPAATGVQRSDTMTLTQISQRIAVRRDIVARMRTRMAGFPRQVGGSDENPLFDGAAVDVWLYQDGWSNSYEPREPAIVTLPNGSSVTLYNAALVRRTPGKWEPGAPGWMELGGDTEPPAYIPLQDAVLSRVRVAGLPDVAVRCASADIFDNGHGGRYITLSWSIEDEDPLPAAEALQGTS